MNCCTIDWFNEWPAEALQCVASSFLQEIPHLGASTEVVNGMVGATLNTQSIQELCSCATSPYVHRWATAARLAEKSSAVVVVVMFPNCFIQIQNQLVFGCLEMAMFISYLLRVIEAHMHILALL